MKGSVPDQDPEREDQRTSAIGCGKRQHKPSLRSMGGPPQDGEQREEQRTTDDNHGFGGRVGKVERTVESGRWAENKNSTESSLEATINAEQEAGARKHADGTQHVQR